MISKFLTVPMYLMEDKDLQDLHLKSRGIMAETDAPELADVLKQIEAELKDRGASIYVLHTNSNEA